MKHLLTVKDFSHDELVRILNETSHLKNDKQRGKECLSGKNIVMLFFKPSTRTRVSFEVGINQLGGDALYLNSNTTQMAKGESVKDSAKVFSRYADGIIIRTYSHSQLEEFASFSSIPVVNALTDCFHPCQAISDIFTIKESVGKLDGIKLTYIGDGASNMSNSLILASKIMVLNRLIYAPKKYLPSPVFLGEQIGKGTVTLEHSPQKAVHDSDFIYTDVWTSMGFEDEKEERIRELMSYQLNDDLLGFAPDNVKIMHCLPACRGQEITDSVIDSTKSIVYDQAENRLHTQKAILKTII